MITKCCECSVRIFMKCLFNQDYEALGGGDFEKIHTEYVDLSNIGQTKEFDLMNAIHNLQTRIMTVPILVQVQFGFFKNFEMPFVNAFDEFKKYGHRITWDPERPELFIGQMERVAIKEKKFTAELDTRLKELTDLKKNGVKVDSNSRHSFVKMLNTLGKEGYQIDKDKTDMEEMSLMIREYDESVRTNNKTI